VTAILVNVIANVRYSELLEGWPLIGLGVWGAILVATPLRAPDWDVLPETFKGTIFLDGSALQVVSNQQVVRFRHRPQPVVNTLNKTLFACAVLGRLYHRRLHKGEQILRAVRQFKGEQLFVFFSSLSIGDVSHRFRDADRRFLRRQNWRRPDRYMHEAAILLPAHGVVRRNLFPRTNLLSKRTLCSPFRPSDARIAMCFPTISSDVYPSRRSAPRLQAFTIPSRLSPRMASPDARESAAYRAVSACAATVIVKEAENHPVDGSVQRSRGSDAHEQRLRLVIGLNPYAQCRPLTAARESSSLPSQYCVACC
jgi:hypothetical protein